MNKTHHIIGLFIQKDGTTAQLSRDEMLKRNPKDGLLWVDLDYNIQENHQWLKKQSKLLNDKV